MTNESERVKFEAWAKETFKRPDLAIHPSLPEHYAYRPAGYAWLAWQARTQSSGPVVAVISWPKSLDDHIHYLKSRSDNGSHMKIQSGLSAGYCYELAMELESFKKLIAKHTGRE